jgi:tetratricopeptide (TPR) repeat protein
MNNSRLIRLLNTFSSKEKRNCRAWIASPVHNQRQDVSHLYDFLWEMQLKDQYLTKSLAWASIYPRTKFNDGKMRQIIHKLLLVVEDYITYQQMKKKEGTSSILLLETLKDRKLFSILDKSVKTTKLLYQKDSTKKNKLQNWESLRFNYELESLQFNAAEQEDRTSALNLQELSDALDIQYFADKLRKACLLYSRLVVFKMNYQPKMLAVVLEQVKELDYLKIPAIGVYYYCYQSLTATKDADEYFEKMMTYLKQHASAFPPQEIRELYLLAINYTIKKINDGFQWHLEKAFDLYKTGITEGYLLEDGVLTPFTYNNTVSIGIRMKEYQWIEQFVYDYKDSVIKEARESIFQECLAKLYYAKKQYKEAQELLTKIKTKDILRILSSKTILAQIYYETNQYDTLEALLDSLKMYLRRKDFVGYHKENYNNITRYLQKLVRVNPFDKKAITKLKEEIELTSILSSKKWLLEQISEL